MQFQHCLTWCGWSINFLLETIELTPPKTLKLKEQLHALLRSKRIKRKLLEQVLGLPGIEVLACAFVCGSAFTTRLHDFHKRTPVACVPLGTKRQGHTGLARARHFHVQKVRSPSDLLSVVPSRKGCAWQTPLPNTLGCPKQAGPIACPLQSKPILARKAAADACAEGTTVGIGGWFISSRSISWFAETWDVQPQRPCLTKEAQRYIACFETLAQLALMRIAWATEGQAVHGLCMPRGRRERQCVSFPRVCTPCRAFSNAPAAGFQANGLIYCPLFRAFAKHSYAPAATVRRADAMTARIYEARNHAGEIESEHAACCRARKYFRG